MKHYGLWKTLPTWLIFFSSNSLLQCDGPFLSINHQSPIKGQGIIAGGALRDSSSPTLQLNKLRIAKALPSQSQGSGWEWSSEIFTLDSEDPSGRISLMCLRGDHGGS